VTEVDDLMRDDDVTAGLDRRLEIVADHACAGTARCHGAGVRVGERDLLVGRCGNRMFHRLKVAHLAAQFVEPGRQPRGPQFGGVAFLPIGGVEHAEIACDAGVDLLHPAPYRDRREVAVAGIHRAHTAAIHRHRAARDEPRLRQRRTKRRHAAWMAMP